MTARERSASPERGSVAYRVLLRLYPADFRARFETEMLALFEQNSAAPND